MRAFPSSKQSIYDRILKNIQRIGNIAQEFADLLSAAADCASCAHHDKQGEEQNNARRFIDAVPEWLG